MRTMGCLAAAALLAVPAAAAADPPAPRPFRFSLGAGGSLLASGGGADHWRGVAALDLYPGGGFGAYGATVAVRSVPFDPFLDGGLATVGLAFEAGASRPLLAIAFHGDAGATFGNAVRPAIGGGLKSHFGVYGPLALAFDSTLHVIAEDVTDYKVVVTFSLLVAISR